MNSRLKETIVNNIKLETPEDYLLVYISHQLNYNELFNKETYDCVFILNNFSCLYTHNDNDFIFINNIMHILLHTLELENSVNNTIFTIDIESVLDILIIIFDNKDHHSLIFKLLFELLNPLLDNILLHTFNYCLQTNNDYNSILCKINILLHNLGAIFLENYLYTKVNIYQTYSINNLNFEKGILKDYKCLLIMTYILSNYINNNNIYYHEISNKNDTVAINNTNYKITLYTENNKYTPNMPNTSSTPNTDNDTLEIPKIEHLLHQTYNNIIFKYSIYLFDFILRPLHYKCIQLKEDISVLNINILALNNRYNYTNHQLLLIALENKKKQTEHIYNDFYTILYNDYLYTQLILFYNNLYRSCLYNKVDINISAIETSITFIDLFYNYKIQSHNINNLEYILLGFLLILNNNTLKIFRK